MILVTLGTNDESFERLLKAIDKEIEKGTIKDRVVVQAGCTKYESKNMEIMDLVPREEFDKLISECDLLITHGGVGSILTGINYGKKVIYIESFAKRTSPTLSGRLVYPVATKFVVQWESMQRFYPKAEYWGWIY